MDNDRPLELLSEEFRGPFLWSCRFRATAAGSDDTVGEALLARTRMGARVRIQMGEGWQESGADAALLEAVLEMARTRGYPALFGWQTERRDSAEAARWLDLGFQLDNERLLVEADAEDVVPSCERQMARVAERVPADARVVLLRDAPLQQVLRLKALAFGGKPGDTARRVRGDGPGGLDSDFSFAVMAGDRVAGIALGTKRGHETLFGDAIAIDPAYRGQWALPLLKGVWLCSAFKLGIRRYQGEIAVNNAVSRKVFRRDGFREVAQLSDFVREIEAGEAPQAQSTDATTVVSGAPGADLERLLAKLRELGWEDSPNTEAGRLRSLPRRADWWRQTAGRLVQMPFVLLKGLPSTRQFRILIVVPDAAEGPGAGYRAALGRAAAQLCLMSNCRVLEIEDAVLVRDPRTIFERARLFLSE